MGRVQNVLKRWSTDQLITGIEIDHWVKMLVENEWKVSPQYFHRAAWVGAWSLPSSILGRLEDARYGREIAQQEFEPTPLFVLGHWRSGTTHLHNLLGRAPGHTYPTVYQVVFPTCFLSTASTLPRLTERFMDDTRTYDNVKQGWHEAAEDEIALAKLCGLSPYISFMFPDHSAKYERYVDFMEVTEAERQKWKDTFQWFLKKIMVQTGGKRVVVKSCTHTARVRLLLEMFPNAKFVHIHRHPYEVFASTLHMRSHTDWENFFHLPVENWEGERERQTLLLGQRIFDRITEDRHLIPEENFIEIAYQDLCGNELDYLEQIYSKFKLPNWEATQRQVGSYVEGLRGYKRNKLNITERQKQQVWDHWQSSFATYGYDRAYEVAVPE